MFALALALSFGTAADPNPPLNPRQVAEAYLAAALADKPDDAAKLVEEGKSPAKPENVKKLKELVGANALALPTVLVSDKGGYALAVSDAIKLPKARPDGADRGCLLLTLKKTKDGPWLLKDIDVRSADEAAARVKDAKEKYDDAKELPATKAPTADRSGGPRRAAVAFGAPPHEAEAAPPPREVKLRAVAEQWSGDLPNRSAAEIEALIADLPPKYRPMVRAYFDQLKKQSHKK